MKQFVRYFSFGLFLASLIIFIFYYYFDEPEIDASEISTDELIELVEEDGFRVITEEDYIRYTVNSDQENPESNEKDEEEPKKDNEDKKDENKDVVKYTLKVKPNTMPHEVILLLEEKKIIKDAEAFAKFMEKENYSPYIQQGEFDLNSEMSEVEIAKTITNK